MSAQPNEPSNRPGEQPNINTPTEEVQQLVWSLVDDQLDESQFARLEQLLVEDESARKTYVECMQLEAELYSHFSQTEAEAAMRETIAPLLGDVHSSILTTPPPVDTPGG